MFKNQCAVEGCHWVAHAGAKLGTNGFNSSITFCMNVETTLCAICVIVWNLVGFHRYRVVD